MNHDPLWIAQVAIAALADIAFASTLGAVLMLGWLWKEKAFATVSPARFGWARARRVGFGGAVLLALANLVSLWLQAASMSGVPVMEAGSSVWTVLTQTHAGIGWAIALAGSLLLVLATASGAPFGTGRLAAGRARRDRRGGGQGVGRSCRRCRRVLRRRDRARPCICWRRASGAASSSRVRSRCSGARHVACARVPDSHRRNACRRWPSSRWCSCIATGAFNAFRGLGGAAGVLHESVWGHVLIVKAVLVGTALIFGALNRWSALPRLKRTASTVDAHTVTGVMRVEAVLMIGVFVAASVLSHSVPGFALAG